MKKRFYLLLLCLMAVFCTSIQSWALVRYVSGGNDGTHVQQGRLGHNINPQLTNWPFQCNLSNGHLGTPI